MKVRFSRRALAHLDEIYDFIATRDEPFYGQRVIERIRAGTFLLQILPYAGHQGKVPGTLEHVIPGLPYIIVYRVEIGDRDQVTILGIYHGNRALHD